MQFPQLQYYTSIEWEEIFSQLPLVKSESDKEIVKNILRKDKKGILAEKQTLRKYGIDNGVGPGYIGCFFRSVITLFFASVENTLHDIGYLIGGSFWDRMRVDYGLLKYSLVGLFDNLKSVLRLNYGIVTKALLFGFACILSIMEVGVILFCYFMVLVFGSFGSFNYKLGNEYIIMQ